MITVDFKRLPIAAGSRVLDVGCGSGRHCAAVHSAARAVVVGVDRNRSDLLEAARRLAWHDATGCHCSGSWHLAAADIRRLPFGDASFDVVLCCEVLEHVPDHGRAVAELARVLRAGGTLAVSVPRYLPERICWALSAAYRNSAGGHIRIYRQRRLRRLIESAGLLYCSRHHAHSFHTPYWWLKCLVGPDNETAAVRLYHRFLVWTILSAPAWIRNLERLLDPLLGKSLVMYFRKP